MPGDTIRPTDTIGVTIKRATKTTLLIPKRECHTNYHNGHTKIEFSVAIVVILYDIHTLEFAVWFC